MRIISGYLKGRILPQNLKLKARPTTDKAKESLFNILNFQVDYDNIKVLDLFSGTGNISFEFISRGVEDITAVELRYDHVKHIQKVNKALDTNLKIIKSDVFKFLKKTSESFDFVFADPPFDMDEFETVYTAIIEANIIKEGGTLVIEHGPRVNFSHLPNFTEHRNYGKVNFTFFQF